MLLLKNVFSYCHLIAFFSALILCILLIFWHKPVKGYCGSDEKEQDSHNNPTSRYGGVAIVLALGIIFLSGGCSAIFISETNLTIITLGLLVFIVGLADDLSGHISPILRTVAVVALAALAGSEIGWLSSTNIEMVDGIVGDNTWLAAVLTLVGVVGLTNSFNLIDGLNGLCAGTTITVLLVLSYIATVLGHFELVQMYSLIAFCTLGFSFLNFPFGKIFLGDGGAYFLGFVVAQGCIFLNSLGGDVSSWVFILMCIYPIWETIFSMWRRLWSGSSWSVADRGHLHTVVYDLVLTLRYGQKSANKTLVNSLVSTVCLIFPIISGVLSILFYNNTIALQISCVTMILVYVVSYYLASNYLRSRSLLVDR